MVKRIIFIAAIASVAAVSAGAGEIESFSARAEKSFFCPVTAENMQAFVPAVSAPVEARDVVASGEYKDLAAAFKNGTVPAEKELMGWHAGRIFDKDMPDSPGSMLLAAVGGAEAYKFVPVATYCSPTFYETMDADLAAGVGTFVRDDQVNWTKPQFGPAGVVFEKIMPSYNKGFSRWEIRKAADNRIVLKYVWKDDMGDYPSEGAAYAYFTKEMTPR